MSTVRERFGAGGFVGTPVSRVDGPLKVRGEATFTAEYAIEGLTYAALVYSTVARGTIARIDQHAARSAPGVLAIVTHENAPPMAEPPMFGTEDAGGGAAASTFPVLRNDEIVWDGQPVAVVVAETQDRADHAASLIRVTYHQGPAATSFDALKGEAEPGEGAVAVGDAAAEMRGAAVAIDQTYRTPRENHNAIEPHATIAEWGDDGRLTVYDATQALAFFKNTIAAVFGLEPGRVRVLAPFVGGGFGGKGMLWGHTLLCAAAAKVAGRPVRLALSREGTFRAVGGRALTEQRVALGATAEGKLLALIHRGTVAVVRHGMFPESVINPAQILYAARAFDIGLHTVALDMVTNTAMRAPGESPGSFALESAIDELAHALGMDPIELRRRNEPTRDPVEGKPFSSRQLVEAYERGAERFGWAERRAAPRSRRDGPWLIGQGVATAYYPYMRMLGSARVRLLADGSAVVQTAAQEMGMGTATVQRQHAADLLGLPLERVTVEYGDSDLPQAALAGGSAQSVSVGAAITAAVEKLHDGLLELVGPDSPLADVEARFVAACDGGLFRTDGTEGGETYEAILRRAGREAVEFEAEAPPPTEAEEYAMGSYGAQFCEVRVHEETGEVRVSRWLGSFDCGRILNPKTATSQFRGGIIMGIGMALTEETFFDERYGRIMNPSLAEYHVPVHLDVPQIDIITTNIPDEHAPLGIHGVGEIGITGVAAAIANAVFNATGKRIRDLPITLDKLL